VRQVFVAGDVTEAHFVRGLLESHGLSATVRGEDLGGTRGDVPFWETWPTVWVLDDSREAEAVELVRQYEAGTGPANTEGGSWRCPRCGQELEPQFTACWVCGAERSLERGSS
jgi:hypothetical protein